MAPPTQHPRGKRARVLLSSVFGPFAQDDIYGSRKNNPMELYQNQVTRVQGVYSLRMFHRSFGLMLIKENLEAPCTLLDFPSLERFVDELKATVYDIVGISSIPLNIVKVQKMCQLVRQYLPHATIVVGGHIANIPDLAERVDADHVVRGEGVRWFRRFLGEDEDQPIRHPVISSGIGTRCMGVDVGSGAVVHRRVPIIQSQAEIDGQGTDSAGMQHPLQPFDDLHAVMRQGAVGHQYHRTLSPVVTCLGEFGVKRESPV